MDFVKAHALVSEGKLEDATQAYEAGLRSPEAFLVFTGIKEVGDIRSHELVVG